MKKYFLIFLAFLFVASVCNAETYFRTTDSFLIAKAVKLGRGATRYSSMSGQIAKEGQSEVNDGSCSSSADCKTGLKCSSKKCVICKDGEQCDSCPKNYVGDGKGGCRIQCIKGQADCELCSKGQIYDGSKCRLPCDGVTCPTGTTCKNGTTSACCVPNEKKCTVANCSNCNTLTGQCEGCASGYRALFSYPGNEILDCVKMTRVCATGQYNDGNDNCLSCANGTKCNSCPSSTPYWCSSSSTCSASATCNSCTYDSDCMVSSGYACVSRQCQKKCTSSSAPYWCSAQSKCTASALACNQLSFIGDCYQPTREELCNCNNNKQITQTMQTKFLCARETVDVCNCPVF